MRRYTIAKTLALFLGVLSVVARSLPERQSEITGGKQFDISTPLTDYSCPRHDHTPLIPDVSDPKQHLEESGLVKVSEGVINGTIYTATYSMSNNTTVPKRDNGNIDLGDGSCEHMCYTDVNLFFPFANDCLALSEGLKNTGGEFTTYSCTSPLLPQEYDTKLTGRSGQSMFSIGPLDIVQSFYPTAGNSISILAILSLDARRMTLPKNASWNG